VARTPVVTIAVAIPRPVVAVVHIPAVVDRNTRAPVIVAIVIAAVVRVTPVARMIYTQVMIGPADRVGGRYAPEVSGIKVMTNRIWVVVNGISVRIVGVHATTRLIDDHFLGLVIRNVNDLVVDRIDSDAVILIGNCLTFIRFQVTGGISAIAK